MTSEAAKERYRETWIDWQTETNPMRKAHLEGRMDAFQESICRGPGPEWTAFKATLPGYNEYWGSWLEQELVKRLDEQVANV